MKTMTFYNEKGGVGKSTFTIMYASWLKYKHGVDVAVVDFNNRLTQYRKDELYMRGSEGVDMDSLWPILRADRREIGRIQQETMSKVPSAKWLEAKIAAGAFGSAKVLLIDLPGDYKDFLQLLNMDMIGLYCIPLGRDKQTVDATYEVVKGIRTCKRMQKKDEGKYLAGIINEVQHFVATRDYYNLAKAFEQQGLPILPDMISFSERIKKFKSHDIMLSTVQYPDWSSKAFEGSGDIGTQNLFIDITRLLNNRPDFRGTPKADLSFADSLEKTLAGQSQRQLVGTAFPEFEFPVSDFDEKRRRFYEETHN